MRIKIKARSTNENDKIKPWRGETTQSRTGSSAKIVMRRSLYKVSSLDRLNTTNHRLNITPLNPRSTTQSSFLPMLVDRRVTVLPTLLRLPFPYLVLICMLCWVEHVDWKLQEKRPLKDHWHPRVQLRRERNEHTGLVQVCLVFWPSSTFLVLLLRSRPFLQRQARHEHQKCGEEDRSDDARIERRFRTTVNVVGRSRCNRDHENC